MRGEALATLGQHEAAIGLWRAVAERGVTSRARLDAFTCWGRSLLERGDLEGSAGVLELCRVALEAEARVMTDEGRKLRVLLRHHLFDGALRRQVVSRYREREVFFDRYVALQGLNVCARSILCDTVTRIFIAKLFL